MFKTITYIEGKSYFYEDYCDEIRLLLIDDDFEEEICCQDDIASLGYCIINIYEKRKLNVAANFALYLQTKSSTGHDLQGIIKTNLEENLLYIKYKDEIERYLTLLT